MTANAGKYRKRITILYPVDTPIGGGGAVRTWAILPGCDSVPAQITYPPPSKKGDEVYTQQQLHTSIFANIAIRYRPSTNINASMRVQYGSRFFEIRTPVTIDEALAEITMQCEELQGQGTTH